MGGGGTAGHASGQLVGGAPECGCGAQVRLLLLAALSGEHVLFIGPPGTAKSELGRRLSQLYDGVFFERLLTRFSVPEVRWILYCGAWAKRAPSVKEFFTILPNRLWLPNCALGGCHAREGASTSLPTPCFCSPYPESTQRLPYQAVLEGMA